jgi:hypothetical protein
VDCMDVNVAVCTMMWPSDSLKCGSMDDMMANDVVYDADLID